MAFESSVLQNGQWTTQTLDVNTVLRHYDQQDQAATANTVEIEEAPDLGLLTQTVIRSPAVHWILPVKLRHPDKNDVAFIGDEFVQIKELRQDGYLHDLIRKESFGSRIRNAQVIGSIEAFNSDESQRFQSTQSTQIKNEDEVDGMDIDSSVNDNIPAINIFPPQSIVLQLESGDSVFLLLRQSLDGTLQFVSNRHRVTKAMLDLQPGTHLAVDPSSRFMAIGCSESTFALYALKPRADLQAQYSQGSKLHYVGVERHFNPRGVILKMEFLYPSHEDDSNVILLVLAVRRGETRMIVYDWDADDLQPKIQPKTRRGYLLQAARRQPLLIIPLTVKSSFILVSATTISICCDILDCPRFVDLSAQNDKPTALFHGSGTPLWTAWARPVRRSDWSAISDDIYIAREDGRLIFIEIDSKEDTLVKAEVDIGELAHTCGPALASLDYHTHNTPYPSADLLITSGDSGPGGAYLIEAREPPIFREPIQSWWPAQDFIADVPDRQQGKHLISSEDDPVTRPDRVFACAGKSPNGSLAEFRIGLEAKLGLEISYDSQINNVWVLDPTPFDDELDDGCLFLLALEDRSSILRLSDNATEISELGPDRTKFDLSSRTLSASSHGPYQIQVTEQSITFICGTKSLRTTREALFEVYENEKFVGFSHRIDLAIIHETRVLFVISTGRKSYLRLVEPEYTSPGSDEPPVHLKTRTLGEYSQRSTCLSLGMISQQTYAITSERENGKMMLVLRPLDSDGTRVIEVPSHHTLADATEAFVSIFVLQGSIGHFVVVCGSRNGLVVTLEVNASSFEIERLWYDWIGFSSVVMEENDGSTSKDMVFARCDSKLFAVTTPKRTSGDTSRRLIPRSISQVYLTDALKPLPQQPPINGLARLRPNLVDGSNGGLLLISGSQLLLASLNAQVTAVPRYLPIKGSPSRILYSPHLQCLVVASIVDGKSTLLMIDPETGDDLSMPSEKKDGKAVDFVPGLGNFNERIFRLIEWPYVKEGKTWMFIIVCTNMGLVILSTQKLDSVRSTSLNRPRDRRIRYYTVHKVKRGTPIYSVTGFDDGLIYCSANTIYVDTLDMNEKKFKRKAQCVLPSPAVNLTKTLNQIYALTAAHSLEILGLVPSRSEKHHEGAGISSYNIIRKHCDQVTRDALHHQTLTDHFLTPIELISDKNCSVAGLWRRENTVADTLETVFEGQLPCSVLRFRSGNTRPLWNTKAYHMGDNFYSGYPESLGISIDGSLLSFTVLTAEAWRILKFIETLYRKSPTIWEDTSDELLTLLDTSPKLSKQVDGDILRKCIDGGYLEELLRYGQDTEQAAKIQAQFTRLLIDLHEEFGERDIIACISQAYMDIDFFLRPVL